jgi:hypothetical protein
MSQGPRSERWVTIFNLLEKLEDQDYDQIGRFRDIQRKAKLALEANDRSLYESLLREIIDLAEAGKKSEEQEDQRHHRALNAVVDVMKREAA